MMSDPTSVDKTTVDELTGKLVLAQGTILRIVTAQPPGDASLGFFQRVAHELSKHGLQFELQVGDEGFPDSVTPSSDATFPPQAAKAPPAAKPTPAPTAGPPPPPPPAVTEPGPPPQQPAAAVPPVPEVPPAQQMPPPDPWAEEAPLEPVQPPPPAAEPIQPAGLDFEPGVPGEPGGLEIERAFPGESGDLEIEPAFPGESGSLEIEPTFPGESDGLEFEPAFPGEPSGLDAGTESPASELEQLIEGGTEGIEFIGGPEELAPAAGAPPPGPPQPDGEATHPPFFPEEEFGRALPDVDEVAAMGVDAAATTAVIETASGQQIRLGSPSALDDAIAAPIPAEQGPSLLRAVGAAILGAFAGAIVWVLLAIPAATGASPLALAVAVMVGFSVRLRGAGHTMPFRIVGILGTLFGSALGSVGAAVALYAMEAGTQLPGIMEMLADKDAVLAAFTNRYGALDLFSLVLAGYLAFRISASKPS
jgi:hypothetical protein